MHEIKNNIPLPPEAKAGRGKPPIYPFASMKDGEHFDEQLRDGETPKDAVRRMRSCSGSYRARHNASISFAVRAVKEKGRTVIRVWAKSTNPPVKKAGAGVADFFAQ